MKTKLALLDAQSLANDLVTQLSFYCERTEIAGSIRRGKSEIGDIEIVAVPQMGFDFFGEPTGDHALNGVQWSDFGKVIKNGNKYKQIELHEGINLDLFIITPPAQWGVIFLIRTGPAEFSHKMVTPRNQGGLMPSIYRIKDGAVWSHNHIIPTPEEKDVFGLFGLQYLEPELRTA